MNKTTTIDITPTWRALLPALVHVAVKGTPEGSKIAMDSLYQLADAVDSMNAEAKESWKRNHAK